MKSYLLFTGNKSLVVLTTYDSIQHPELLKKLESEGIFRFIAHEVSVESARSKYGMYFDFARNDIYESDGIKIMSYSYRDACDKFSFNELGNPVFHEPKSVPVLAEV